MPWPLASKEFNHVEKNIVLSKRMSKRKKQKSLLSGNFFSRKREKEKAVEEFFAAIKQFSYPIKVDRQYL